MKSHLDRSRGGKGAYIEITKIITKDHLDVGSLGPQRKHRHHGHGEKEGEDFNKILRLHR